MRSSNDGLAYSRVTLSPRWTSAGVDSVKVTVKLAASDSYISYRYKHNPSEKTIKLHVTGSGDLVHLHALLPGNDCKVQKLTVNGREINYSVSEIEKSRYADFDIIQPGINEVVIQYL